MSEDKVKQSSIETGFGVLQAKIERDAKKILQLEVDVEFYTGKVGALCEARLLCAERDLMLRKAMTKQLEQVIMILKELK